MKIKNQDIPKQPKRYCFDSVSFPDTWIEGYWYMRGQLEAYNHMLNNITNGSLNLNLINEEIMRTTDIAKKCLDKDEETEHKQETKPTNCKHGKLETDYCLPCGRIHNA